SLVPPSPRSTPFPYTTLFRSDERHKRVEQHKLEAMLALCEETRCRRQALLAYFDEDLPQPCGHCDNCIDTIETWDGTDAARQALDRKSTRLNSSHVSISYAVF